MGRGTEEEEGERRGPKAVSVGAATLWHSVVSAGAGAGDQGRGEEEEGEEGEAKERRAGSAGELKGWRGRGASSSSLGRSTQCQAGPR